MSAKMGSTERIVPVTIRVMGLPPRTFEAYSRIELGIQSGKVDIDPPTKRTRDGAVFSIQVRVQTKAPSRTLNFLGPYIQGTPQDRFIYLSWTGLVRGRRQMFRRIKLPLKSIRYSQVLKAMAGHGRLEASISGIDPDGGPACATVPLLGKGWTVAF